MNRAPDFADLGFRVGDHVCAFYSEGGYSRDDIVVDYVTKESSRNKPHVRSSLASTRARGVYGLFLCEP